MNKGRLVSVAGVVALAGSLSACGSGSKSTSSAPAPAPAQVTTTASAPVAPTTDATPAVPTIASLLAAFGPGPITADHMPTAPVDWLARVQSENPQYDLDQVKGDSKMRNLMALVDEAAREKNLPALAQMCSDLCDAASQQTVWSQPGILDELSRLIEKTPMTGEGAAIPAFVLTRGDTKFADAVGTAYGTANGYQGPADYFAKHPYYTAFQNGSGGPGLKVEWRGLIALKAS